MDQHATCLASLGVSAQLHQELLVNQRFLDKLVQVANLITCCYKNGGRVLLCGNGGSAADAQHIAAELTGRFMLERAPLSAEALNTNTSVITAIANDYSFVEVFSRQVRAVGRRGDVLIAISTSGNSENIIRAIREAILLGIVTIGLVGRTGGNMKNECEHLIFVPSDETPRIQECHILMGHIICELVEGSLFGNLDAKL